MLERLQECSAPTAPGQILGVALQPRSDLLGSALMLWFFIKDENGKCGQLVS